MINLRIFISFLLQISLIACNTFTFNNLHNHIFVILLKANFFFLYILKLKIPHVVDAVLVSFSDV